MYPRLILFLSVLIACASSSRLAATEQTTSPLLSSELTAKETFSSRFRHFHAPSGRMFMDVRLWVGPEGIRVDQLPLSEGFSIVVNHAREAVWLLDALNRRVHRVPLVPVADESGVVASVTGSDAEAFAGLVLNAPCQSRRAVHDGTEVVNGRVMQLWRCGEGDDTEKTSWFDDELGVVVKTMTPDGMVSLHSDIRKNAVGEPAFLPPSDYRWVSMDEFVGSLPALGRYQ